MYKKGVEIPLMKHLNARAAATLEGGAWAENINNMIAFYNSVKGFNDTYPYADRTIRARAVVNFVILDVKKISWSYNVKQELIRGRFLNLKRHASRKVRIALLHDNGFIIVVSSMMEFIRYHIYSLWGQQ